MGKTIKRFEDLEVWKESMRMCVEVYKELKDCTDFGLRDQMQRAAVSIPSNIAEGYERNSNKEFIQFLYIAKGSASELRTQIYIAREVSIISRDVSNNFINQTKQIASMLYNLIKTRTEKFQ